MSHRDPQLHLSQRKAEDGTVVLVLEGRLLASALDECLRLLAKVLKASPPRVRVDVGGVGHLDSGGALTLTLMEQAAADASVPLEVVGLSQKGKDIRELIDPEALTMPPLIPELRRVGLVTKVGEGVFELGDEIRGGVTFLGDFTRAVGHACLHPAGIRWRDVAVYMEKVGVDGLPIVGLISFLLGLIIAYMSSLQLNTFGANIWVASLVGLAMTRELGPIMTAILIAGRSGSAFAAEIGTMKVNEEVDALTVMGYDPTGFLALPKIIATFLVMPLLTLYSDLLGILGGLVVGWLSMDLTVYSYVEQTAKTLGTWDVTSGLVKSLVFAIIIAAVGCQRGFTVKGGAAGVGTVTTSAVVAAMALIIVANSIFAILFYVVL